MAVRSIKQSVNGPTIACRNKIIETEDKSTLSKVSTTMKSSVGTMSNRIFPQKYRRDSSESWLWEVIGIVVCVSTLIAIFAILLAYDQKPQPHTIGGISLNTAVSILATLSRASVIFVAASVVAQQKWLKFVRSRDPLSLMLPYDDATRGPLGAISLLLSGPKSVVVIVVSLVTVLALGFEPFVQQSLRYPLRDAVAAKSLPVLRAVTNVSYAGDPTSNHSTAFHGMLVQALFSDAVAPLQPACPENSCSWPSYWTAGICSSCEDVLAKTSISSDGEHAFHDFMYGDFLDAFEGFNDLSRRNEIWTHHAQTNYNISMGKSPVFSFSVNSSSSLEPAAYMHQNISYPEEILFDASNPVIGVDQGSTFTMPVMSGPFNALGYVRLNRSRDGLRLEVTAATKCSISFCAREQSSTVVNGSFNTRIHDQAWGSYEQSYPSWADLTTYTWTAQLGDHYFQTVDLSQVIDHIESRTDMWPIVAPFANLITGLVGSSIRSFERDPHAWNYVQYTLLDPPPNAMQFMSDTYNSSAKIAQIFTNYFHQHGNKQIRGEAYDTVPFVDVHWPWLAFPLAIVIICFTTLLITIYQTRRRGLPTWKTSTFPLLFAYQPHDQEMVISTETNVEPNHAASGDGDENVANDEREPTQEIAMLKPVEPGESTSSYSALAKATSVRLVKRDGGWIFDREAP